jgi:hypothetical protein
MSTLIAGSYVRFARILLQVVKCGDTKVDWYRFLISYLVLTLSLCLTSTALGATITIPVKEVAKEWLAAKGIKDASKDLKELLDAAEKGEKAPKALLNFEKAILDGKPLDPEKHALAVALNLLRLNEYAWSVVVPDYKYKSGVIAFTESSPVVFHPQGSNLSEADLATIPGLKGLGEVKCWIEKVAAKADRFEVPKGKPGTARLTFSLSIIVACNGSKVEYPWMLGPYRITARENIEWRKLKKWK